MRQIKHVFIVIILLFLLINHKIIVLAMNTGFSTETLSEEDTNTFLTNVEIALLTEEPQRKAIECFDVNEDEMIAIGSGGSEHKTICVYSKEGIFQYGYEFSCSGTFGIEWGEENINIYFVRSDVAVEVNHKGKVESILKIQNTSSNSKYWRNTVFITEKIVGDSKYRIKNDIGIFNLFASSYSQLVVTTDKDNEMIIYDVNTMQFLNIFAVFVSVMLFVSIVIGIFIKQYMKYKRR